MTEYCSELGNPLGFRYLAYIASTSLNYYAAIPLFSLHTLRPYSPPLPPPPSPHSWFGDLRMFCFSFRRENPLLKLFYRNRSYINVAVENLFSSHPFRLILPPGCIFHCELHFFMNNFDNYWSVPFLKRLLYNFKWNGWPDRLYKYKLRLFPLQLENPGRRNTGSCRVNFRTRDTFSLLQVNRADVKFLTNVQNLCFLNEFVWKRNKNGLQIKASIWWFAFAIVDWSLLY